jgi:hypothetical protein
MGAGAERPVASTAVSHTAWWQRRPQLTFDRDLPSRDRRKRGRPHGKCRGALPDPPGAQAATLAELHHSERIYH